ncbi:hypothetical protein ABZ865_25830 [Streptomyces sp. NPDC047085]|uniref:hypothetical protein n=1 Tax=Streptomyces sp. NPDC047085 TaxID=3155140 RepID=UPI0033E6B90D
MGKFEVHGGPKSDFDFNVGLAEGDWDCRQFGDRLWSDVAHILETSFDGSRIEPGKCGSYYNYWFENDNMSVSLYVDDGDPGCPLEKVPAMLTARSRSDTVETWQLAERLYDRLTALDDYLVIVFAENGMPIDANFDIGDDW